MTPPQVTTLVENGASVQEALTRIVDSMGEQSEQMSKRMSELEIAVHVERKSCGKKSTASNRKSVRAENV